MAYINKAEPPERILATIRDVLQGRICCSDAVRQHLVKHAVSAGDDCETTVDSLSDRELQVFEMLGRGRTTREIAELMGLAQKTVETYRENIKAKLHLVNGNQLIRHAEIWADRHS